MTNTIPQRFFEDFEAGMTLEFGNYPMTEDDIIKFAKLFDPQPFHTNPTPPPGGAHALLVASGWHTGAVTMRMMVDHFIPQSSVLLSPGHDELRWLKPVRPGDRLRVRLTVLKTRLSASKPDRGIVTLKIETLNQEGDVVMHLISPNLFKRRNFGGNSALAETELADR